MKDKLKHFFLSNTGLWFVFITWTLFISNLWLPRNWGFYGTDDWDLTYSTFEVARKSIVEYGQWPSFNPYCSFGSDLDANPQATHASIFFIPVLLFGTFYGYKLSILLAIIIGCWGAYKLFSSLTQDKFVALCMSLIFCGCAYFSRHIFQAGHSNTLYFYLLPWLMYFLNRLRSGEKFTDFLWAVLILCQTIIGGAPFVFIASVLLIFLWSIGLIWIEKTRLKPILLFGSIILLSLGLAFWKIWPAMQFWNDMPRLANDETGINLLIWLQALGDIETDTRTYHGWHEFAMGFSLVMAGITLYYFKHVNNGKKWLVLCLFIFWLSIGNMPAYFNPWYILNHYIPVFTSLRSPYRFGILIVFILSVAFLKSINNITDKQFIYIVLIYTVLTQTLSYNAISKKIIGSPRLESFRQDLNRDIKPIRMNESEKQSQFILIRNNYLLQNSYEPLFLSKVTDSMNTFVKGGELLTFTPHNITINSSDTEVYVNIRHSENWHLSGHGNLENKNGLIHVKNASGKLNLAYKNHDLNQGLIVSMISVNIFILTSIFLFRKRKTIPGNIS